MKNKLPKKYTLKYNNRCFISTNQLPFLLKYTTLWQQFPDATQRF